MNLRVILLVAAAILFCNCLAVDLASNCSVAECVNTGNRDRSSAIVCNDCMSRILSNPDAETLLREVKQKTIGGHNRKRFADLNTDVLSVIFEELEIMDMIKVVDIFPDQKFLAVAYDTFWRRYKNYEVFNDMRFGPKGIEVYSEHIATKAHAVTLLRLFGGGIQKLKIESPTTMVIEYINKYARSSLTEFSMTSLKKKQFEYFKQPFGELRDLYLSSDATIKAGKLTFCELFPKLERLGIWFNEKIEQSMMDCKFEHLEHFNVYERNLGISNLGKESIFALIIKNPQIRSIEMETLSQDFYDVLNEHVQHLENLTFADIRVENDISFEHVKHLSIHFIPTRIDKLSLPRLESIEMGYDDESSEPLARFLEKHQNISRLNVKGAKGYGIDYQLTLLASQLPNLVEITLSNSKNSVRGETITEIIDKCLKLQKFNFIPDCVQDKHINRLRQKYENDWNIIQNNSTDTLIFEKKN